MKREFIKGRPVLVVIDIQAETFGDITVEAIPAMAGYADRMSSTRCSLKSVLAAIQGYTATQADTA